MKRGLLIGVLVFLLLSGFAAAEVKPKSIDSMSVKITQGGTIFIEGFINTAELKVYIPQEGIETIDVTPDSWEYGEDEFGNRVVIIKLENVQDDMEYSIESVVNTGARHLSYDKPLASADSYPEFLVGSETIFTTPEISSIAYPYSRNLGGVAGLAIWVYDHLTYDKSLAGELKPCDWVLENRRGVCAEYANLFTALVRSKGIPVKYASGLVSSEDEGKFIEHAWAEIPLQDGTTASFDPTWLEGGYLDGTHIKFGVFLDGNHSEELKYVGRGSVSWERNDDVVEILGYEAGNLTAITASGGRVSFLESGLVEAGLETEGCLITRVTASSCIDSKGDNMLEVLDPVRNLWFCHEERLYWAFDVKELDRGFIYTCPVAVYDQMGSQAQADVSISGLREPESISIEGPDTARVGEEFLLSVGGCGCAEYTFFSPNMTITGYKAWTLRLDSPGTYTFYLHSDGALARKDVEVVMEKEFQLSVNSPANVSAGESFVVIVNVKNLLEERQAKVRVEFAGETQERDVTLQPGEEAGLEFNLTAGGSGTQKILVSVLGDSLTGYSSSIEVLGAGGGIIDAIAGFFQAIIDFFAGLFG